MATRGGLFAGKLQAPDVMPGGVVRNRLYRPLNEGVATGLAIVCAPAGTGKTQLVAEWVARPVRRRADVAWVTLDQVDRDPARFLRYVIHAIGSTPAGRVAVSGLLPLPPFAPPDDEYLVAVQAAMDRLSRNVVLILDDFHDVVGSPTEDLVRRIVRFQPARVRLIVLTRVEPSLGQGRLRLLRRLTEVGPAELALTVGETRAVFMANGVTLGDAELGRVHEWTGGWAAAVQIIAASLRGKPDIAAAIHDLPMGITALSEFLTAEVYECQPLEMQTFMLRTCVVDHLCAGLADALTGGSDGCQKVAQLQRARLLLDTAEDDGRWFGWNPTFASFLRRHLHEQEPESERELHRRAARWLRDRGRPVSAVKQALAGNDVETAASILGDCWLDTLVSSESAVLKEVLGEFPADAALTHADVAAARAFTGARAGDIEESFRLAGRAVELASEFPVRRRHAIEVMSAVVRLYIATMTGGPCDGADGAALALLAQVSGLDMPLTRGDRIRRALLLYNLGAFETSRQRYDVAEEHLRAALAEAQQLDLPYLELSCHAQLVEHDMQIGKLTRAENHGKKVLKAARERGWHSYHGLTAAHVNLAGIALLRDELDATLRHVADASRIVRRADRVNRFRISYLSMMAFCAAGKVNDAAAELDRLHAQIGDADVPTWMLVMLDDAQARRDACCGHPEQGLLRVERAAAHPTAPWITLAHELLRAELLLRCGRAAEARKVLAPHIDAARQWSVGVAALVLDALAAEALGAHGEALTELGEALEMAAPERLIGPFVTPGPQVRPLIEELLDRGTAEEALALEIIAHGQHHDGRKAVSGYSLTYVEPLSHREMDVLRQLPSTLTSAELAKQLHVSVNTLRTHMKRINRKLGASSRRDAVRRARDLGIL